jgi:phospholipid/cholesterol/gamma-HCH transport system ATP-binding protein
MGMLASLIARLNKALGLTTIIVSHDVDETAAIADYIHVIADGAIRGQGPTEQVINSEDPRVQQFVRGLPDGPVPFHYPAEPLLADLGLESRA